MTYQYPIIQVLWFSICVSKLPLQNTEVPAAWYDWSTSEWWVVAPEKMSRGMFGAASLQFCNVELRVLLQFPLQKSGSDWQTSSGRESLQVHSSQSLRHDLGPFPFLTWIRCAWCTRQFWAWHACGATFLAWSMEGVLGGRTSPAAHYTYKNHIKVTHQFRTTNIQTIFSNALHLYLVHHFLIPASQFGRRGSGKSWRVSGCLVQGGEG